MLNKILAAMLVIPLVLTSSTALPQNKYTEKEEKELRCLAENIYHEAGNQSQTGKIGVAFVTLNRARNPLYPSDVCKVVYERYNEVCQFSWVCEAKVISDSRGFKEAKRIAKLVYARYNEMVDPTEGALFFHAHYVSPPWNRQHIRTVRIDDHIFYRPKPRKT